jgi:hypothetical protein
MIQVEEEKKAEEAASQKDYSFNDSSSRMSQLHGRLQIQDSESQEMAEVSLGDSEDSTSFDHAQASTDANANAAAEDTVKDASGILATATATTAAQEPPEPSSTTTIASNDNTYTDNDEDCVLHHKLAPGDHVIRWELLPIAWPIQVHGIVLETGKGFVSICDFGLTAEPLRETNTEETATATTETNNNNKGFQAAWDKVKPPDQSKKQRITVHLLTTMEELKAWKKVNYGHGLFGGGGEPDDDSLLDQASQHSRCSDKDKNKEDANTNKHNNNLHQRVGKWWHNVTQRKPTPPSPQGKNPKKDHDVPLVTPGRLESTSIDTPTTSESFTSPVLEEATTTTTCVNDSLGTNQQEARDPGIIMATNHTSTTILGTNGTANDVIDTNGTIMDLEEKPCSDRSKQTSKEQSPRKGIFQMIKRSASRSRSPVRDTNSKNSSNNNSKNKNSSSNNNKIKLPKSDPPKLVLARTTYILAHGDSVLPPYHPFKANSECIAVFCKTGRWSTLQASVFLHSTAIGNAKSSMAMTLGIAASVPLLAPAIAGIGIMAVGAPYVILNQSREFWQQQTIRLNDLVWSQAEPEVFVECIEHWSKLIDQKPAVVRKQQQNNQSMATRQSKTDAVLEKTKEEENAATSKGKNGSTTSSAMEDSDGNGAGGEVENASNPEMDRSKNRYVSV